MYGTLQAGYEYSSDLDRAAMEAQFPPVTRFYLEFRNAFYVFFPYASNAVIHINSDNPQAVADYLTLNEVREIL